MILGLPRGLSFQEKMKVKLCNQNTERLCFPGSLSAGNGGTTGTTVEMEMEEAKKAKRESDKKPKVERE